MKHAYASALLLILAIAPAYAKANRPIIEPDPALERRLHVRQIYESEPSDTLAHIAKEVYGHESWSAKILRWNPHARRWKAGNTLPTGTKLEIRVPRVGDVYVVQIHDTLSRIALWKYGNKGQWTVIHSKNSKAITDPDFILPGQELHLGGNGTIVVIPAVPTVPPLAMSGLLAADDRNPASGDSEQMVQDSPRPASEIERDVAALSELAAMGKEIALRAFNLPLLHRIPAHYRRWLGRLLLALVGLTLAFLVYRHFETAALVASSRRGARSPAEQDYVRTQEIAREYVDAALTQDLAQNRRRGWDTDERELRRRHQYQSLLRASLRKYTSFLYRHPPRERKKY